MDLSKLPRMSQTPAPPPPAADENAPPPIAPAYDEGRATRGVAAPQSAPSELGVGGGAEAWLSIAIGAILLLIFRRLLQYISHLLFGTYFAPYVMPDGTQVPYTSQLDFWSDLGVTAFALVLIVDGILIGLGRSRPKFVAFAFGLTVLATLYNLGYLVMTLNQGLPLVSVFAVAFGVYIALIQWKMLQAIRAIRQYQRGVA